MFSAATHNPDSDLDSWSLSDASDPITLSVKATATASTAATNAAHGPIKMKRTGQVGMPAGRPYSEVFNTLPASRTAPATSRPTAPAVKPPNSTSASNTPGLDNDEEIELVTSDVIRRSPEKSLDSAEHTPIPTSKPQILGKLPGSHGKRTEEMPRKQMSEAQQQNISETLKQRWADGRMAHVPDKIRETKRKSMARGDDEAARPHKKQREHLSSPAASSTPRPSGSNDVWEYLRPFLVNYSNSQIPKNKRVKDLLELPRVRDVEWNEFSKRPFFDGNPQSLASIILYVIGEVQQEPCFRCREHKGPFKGCVKLPEGLHFSIPHCSNCYYSHQVCHSELWAGPKRASNVHEQQTIADLDESKSEYDEVEDKNEADSAEIPTKSFVDNGPLSFVIDPILEAPSGRSYDEWVDDEGKHISQNGQLLFPDGYELDKQDKARPWICPVADCRGTYIRRSDLRCHFSRKHYAAMLNDNLDGTFEFLGYYDERRGLLSGGGFPADPPSLPIVVSQTSPGGKGNTSLAHPSSAPMRLQPRGADHDDYANSKPMSESVILQTMTPTDARKARAMWDYIQPHLHDTRTIPASGHVKELLPSTRVRDLQWNPNSTRPFVENKPKDISCMIIQVTGEQAPEPCSECAKGKGPFDGCVVIDRNAHPDVRSCMISCANCNYHGHQTGCSIKNWVQEREQHSYPPYFNPKAKRTAEKGEDVSKPPRKTVSSSVPRQTTEPACDQTATEASRTLRPRQSQAAVASSSALIAPGQIPPAGEMRMLDMEEWEIAPGRIRSQASDTPDNIALSHAYLGASQGTQVSDDLTLRIADVRGGTALRFDAEQDKIRICTVVSGRLKVRIEGEPEFIVGPLGMFKVRPGATCTAMNTSYFWAAVFVLTQTE